MLASIVQPAHERSTGQARTAEELDPLTSRLALTVKRGPKRADFGRAVAADGYHRDAQLGTIDKHLAEAFAGRLLSNASTI